tara:strand:+ start:807 stop:2993 length:2187 start_codon:yes stop_codon:yes gene_type:complete
MAKKGELDLKFVVDTSKPVKNLNELQERVETLRNTIEGAPLGSKEFERLTAQLQEAGSEMKILEKNMEGLEPQQKAEAFLKMGEGIAGGFAVAQGAMGLIGVESEDLEKIQVKVQSAIAIATGIRMMSEAALMFATAKRIAVEKIGLITTKSAIVFAKAAAVGNALWAVGNGVLTMSIGATSVALKALKVAIMSTGIGALALLIIGLVVAVVSYVNSTDSASAAQKRQAQATRDLRDALLEETNAVLKSVQAHKEQVELEYALADANTEAEKSLLKKQEKLKNMEGTLAKLAEAQKKNNDLLAEYGDDKDWLAANQQNIIDMNIKIELQKQYNRAQMDGIRVVEQTIEAEKKADADREASRQRGKARRKQRQTDAETLRKLENELLLLEIEDIELREQTKREQQLADELAAAGEIRNKTIRLDTIQNIQDIFDQEEINRKKKKDEEIEKEHQSHLDEMTKMNEEYQNELFKKQEDYLNEYYNSLNTAQQNEENAVIDKYFELLTNADEYGLSRAELEEAQEAELAVIRQKYDDEEAAKEDEALAAKFEIMQNVLDGFAANMDARQSELDNQMNRELAVEGLTEEQKLGIQEKFEGKKKKLDKKQKAIAASSAVIQTYLGATAAFTSMASIPFVGPVLGGVAAAAAITSGLANVRAIYAQDVGDGGGGGGGGGGSTPNTTPTSARAATTGSFTLGGGTNEPEPVKAYVVTDEMTNSQDQLEGIRNQSTI